MQRQLYIECMQKYNNEIDITWQELAEKYGISTGKILSDRWQRIKDKVDPILEEDGVMGETPCFQKNKNAPKILIFDIETHLKNAKLFRHGKQYVNASSFSDYDSMICWSAKWVGDNEVFGDVQTSTEAVERDNSRVTKSLWDALSSADLTVSHNGINFDLPMVNTFFIENRLGLPNFFRNIDTCSIARKNFKFESNSLDHICKRLGINDGKMDTSIELWEKCYVGEKESLSYMFEYNQMDVTVLEDLYNVFLPYIPSFPNLGVWGDVTQAKCPYCGSTNFEEKGYKYTPSGKFNSYRCECQALFRSKENLLSKEFKKLQMVT